MGVQFTRLSMLGPNRKEEKALNPRQHTYSAIDCPLSSTVIEADRLRRGIPIVGATQMAAALAD